MSAFVVTRETLRNAVLGFATALNEYKGRSTVARKEGNNCVLDCNVMNEIARDFYALNVKAVNGRYNENEDTTLPADIFSPREVHYAPLFLDCFRRKAVVSQLKCLSCLEYQCAEDATINNPLYEEICQAKGLLALYIVQGMEEYRDAAWG